MNLSPIMVAQNMPLGQMRHQHHDSNDPNVTPMPGHVTPIPHPHQGRGQGMMSPTSDPFNPVRLLPFYYTFCLISTWERSSETRDKSEKRGEAQVKGQLLITVRITKYRFTLQPPIKHRTKRRSRITSSPHFPIRPTSDNFRTTTKSRWIGYCW